MRAVSVQLLSCIHLFAIPWTVVCPAPLSMARILEWVDISSFRESSRPRDPGIDPMSPALAGGFFTGEPPGKPKDYIIG